MILDRVCVFGRYVSASAMMCIVCCSNRSSGRSTPGVIGLLLLDDTDRNPLPLLPPIRGIPIDGSTSLLTILTLGTPTTAVGVIEVGGETRMDGDTIDAGEAAVDGDALV